MPTFWLAGMSESGKKRVLGADQIFLPAASFPFMPRIVDRAHVECRSELLHFLSGKVTTLSTSSAFGLDRRDVALPLFLQRRPFFLQRISSWRRIGRRRGTGRRSPKVRTRAAGGFRDGFKTCLLYIFIFESVLRRH